MAELEYIEPSERTGRVGSKIVEFETTPTSRYLHHDEAVSEDEYTSGWRLHLVTLALSVGIFSAQMESSIVSTSIVSITNELKGFDEASWVFTSYMLTYAGLIMIWAKLSDIFGRKNLILLATVFFIFASGGCGACKTLYQLMGLRCLQGIGASGIFSIGSVVFFELVPSRKYPNYTALISLVITLSVVLGPLLGGLINNHTTWRWVFYLNIPLGTVTLALLSLLLPRKMPYTENTTCTVINFRSLIRIDITGALLLLGLCIFIVTPLQLAATGDSFDSVVNIVLFICAGVFLAATLFWEWFVTTKRELPEPVFPWRFLTDRRVCGMILNVFFAGGILIVCIIQLPQRFQTVNEDTAYRAATRLLVFGIFIPIAGGVSSLLISNIRVPPVHLIIVGTFFQIAGTVGLSMTSNLVKIYSSQYAFLILAGVGIGVSNVAIIIMVPFVVQKRDLAVGIAVMTQFRVLGGILCLSIVTSVMNRTIRKDLLLLLTPVKAEMVLRSPGTINELPLKLGNAVRSIFGQGYNLQMKVMIGFAIAQLPATALIWTRYPLKVAK